jgi:hypothetical protein
LALPDYSIGSIDGQTKLADWGSDQSGKNAHGFLPRVE